MTTTGNNGLDALADAAALEQGEDLRTVQLLLGHKSIKTTEKHYAPFVKSFQKILDAATARLDFGTGIKEADSQAEVILIPLAKSS